MGDHPAWNLDEELTILRRQHCRLRNVSQDLLEVGEL